MLFHCIIAEDAGDRKGGMGPTEQISSKNQFFLELQKRKQVIEVVEQNRTKKKRTTWLFLLLICVHLRIQCMHSSYRAYGHFSYFSARLRSTVYLHIDRQLALQETKLLFSAINDGNHCYYFRETQLASIRRALRKLFMLCALLAWFVEAILRELPHYISLLIWRLFQHMHTSEN